MFVCVLVGLFYRALMLWPTFNVLKTQAACSQLTAEGASVRYAGHESTSLLTFSVCDALQPCNKTSTLTLYSLTLTAHTHGKSQLYFVNYSYLTLFLCNPTSWECWVCMCKSIERGTGVETSNWKHSAHWLLTAAHLPLLALQPKVCHHPLMT